MVLLQQIRIRWSRQCGTRKPRTLILAV
jgi:hypothetical protein